MVKNEAAEEQITAQTVREIAAIAGYSEEVINNTTQFSAKQMSNLTKIDTAASGLGESWRPNEKPSISRKETIEL